MNTLHDIVSYICQAYPLKRQLTKARLTKIVYLADWVMALKEGKQITPIKWEFNHYGPYVDDVVASVENDNDFEVEHAPTMFGGQKFIVKYIGSPTIPDIDTQTKAILDRIISRTYNKNFSQFIDLVYNTYPVKSKNRYSVLDLPALAKEYKEKKVEAAT